MLLLHCIIFAQVATASSLLPVPGKLSASIQVNGYFWWVNLKDREVSKMESCGQEAHWEQNI